MMYLTLLKSRSLSVRQKIKQVIGRPSVLPTEAGLSGKISYQDTWVKIIGSLLASHYVEVLGRDESLFYLLLQKFYYIDVISGFFIAFAVWELISRITRYLDGRFVWEEQPLVRALLQISLGVFAPTIVLHLLTYLQFTYLIGQQMSDTTWYIYELPVCMMLILLLNTYYLAYFFVARYQHLKQQPPVVQPLEPVESGPGVAGIPAVKKTRRVFIISKGQRNIPLPVEEIAYFYKKEDYCYLRTFAEETYLIDESLEDIYAQLDEQLFFRANRQTIINFQACTYYACLDYGKLEVALLPQSDDPVVISQKRAPLFKEWVSR